VACINVREGGTKRLGFSVHRRLLGHILVEVLHITLAHRHVHCARNPSRALHVVTLMHGIIALSEVQSCHLPVVWFQSYRWLCLSKA
jgi:hypothetical protein